MLARLPILAALFSIALVASPSAGWEQTESDLGYPLEWLGSCYHYSLHQDGSDDVAFDDLSAIARAAFDAWEEIDCSYYRFLATEPAQIDEQAFHTDQGNANLLVWRETADSWAYSPLVVALTSVHYDPASGVIQDVDIEFNGYDFEFATLDSYPDGSELVDLQSTITHEIGHTIGLAHSDVTQSTMSAYDDPGSTDKRTLEQDDIDGACALYPLGQDPEICEEPWCGLDLDGSSKACATPGSPGDDGCSCSAPGRPAGAGLPDRLLGLIDWLLL
jgi:hypothetical protein